MLVDSPGDLEKSLVKVWEFRVWNFDTFYVLAVVSADDELVDLVISLHMILDIFFAGS